MTTSSACGRLRSGNRSLRAPKAARGPRFVRAVAVAAITIGASMTAIGALAAQASPAGASPSEVSTGTDASGPATADGVGDLIFRPPVDDYPYKAQALAGGIDPWRFQYGECVSFVAWKLNEAGGTTRAPWSFTNYNLTAAGNGIFWGNGGHWAEAAKVLGYRVDG